MLTVEPESANPTLTPSKVFSSPQSLGKAVSRVNRALPKSPRKKIAIVKRLVQRFHPVSVPKMHEPTEAELRVEKYYNSDLVSRQLPGRKDYVTTKTAAGKKRVQKKVLMMTVMEAHKLFAQENPDIKIGKSKFAALRPKHVLPISEKDHNVCCCRYHENVELLVDGLKTIFLTFTSVSDLVKKSVCSWQMLCCTGLCDVCKDVSQVVSNEFGDDVDPEATVVYYQWSAFNKKEVIESMLADAKDELVKQLSVLRKHSYIAKVQLQSIRALKEKLQPDEAVLQEDFSENFIIKQQDEIMAAHWVTEGITLFTAVLTTASSSSSFVVVSDDLQHDKVAVWCCNKTILNHAITESSTAISNLHFFFRRCSQSV